MSTAVRPLCLPREIPKDYAFPPSLQTLLICLQLVISDDKIKTIKLGFLPWIFCLLCPLPESLPMDQLLLYLLVHRFHFPQCLGMMGPRMRMMDALCLQISLKTVYPMPGIKYKSTVCQHLFHLAVAVYGLLHYSNDRINGGFIQKGVST